jgi:AraC-like DNA-binding protein
MAGLDRRRLTRVLDYIGANLEDDLTLARLAAVACLSRFHFSRAFKAAVGRSPHHYVSAKRLELAKQLLGKGDRQGARRTSHRQLQFLRRPGPHGHVQSGKPRGLALGLCFGICFPRSIAGNAPIAPVRRFGRMTQKRHPLFLR